ncbi:MAG: alkaline phosphatase D family protein [Verrucomicrobiota bacterium]
MKSFLVFLATASLAHADIGPWCGAVTPTSAVVKIKSATIDQLTLNGQTFPATRSGEIATFNLTGLQPDHEYNYGPGTFRTFPTGNASFKFAFGSCGKGNDVPVYETIAKQKPLFYLNLGDLHYSDIATNDVALFRMAYDTVFSGRRYAQLFASVPFVYMWDDHDYGPNDSAKTSPSRQATWQAYREYIPHYPLADSGAIYQTFEVGRVKFILTDLRSERTPNDAPDDAAKSMLGEKQKAWFKQELLNANGKFPVIFWISSVNWIGKPEKVDHWAAFTTERRELANFIKENKIKGVCILSGDAHMTAADDGTNGDYADGKGAPIPVLLSSPLDRPGFSKGGPFSHGMYVPGAGEGLYGLVTVVDKGDEVEVQFSGRNQLDVEKIALKLSLPAL